MDKRNRTRETVMKSPGITAALLVIGEEILSGRTRDENIAHIACCLDRIGIVLDEVRIVPDRIAQIAKAINNLRQSYDYLLTTGGIGPTHDDVTTDAVAAAFGVAVIEPDLRAVKAIQDCFPDRHLDTGLLRMARLPDGAELVANPLSGAPGYMIGNVVVMAGLPQVMRIMMESVSERLDTGRRLRSCSIRIEAIESEVALALADLQKAHPDVRIGSYPYFEASGCGTHVVFRSADQDLIEDAAEALRHLLDREKMRYADL